MYIIQRLTKNKDKEERCFLKWSSEELNHYVTDIKEAKIMTLSEANQIMKKIKNKEGFKIIGYGN